MTINLICTGRLNDGHQRPREHRVPPDLKVFKDRCTLANLACLVGVKVKRPPVRVPVGDLLDRKDLASYGTALVEESNLHFLQFADLDNLQSSQSHESLRHHVSVPLYVPISNLSCKS